MSKKLIWERQQSDLRLYHSQNYYELNTPTFTLPFTNRGKMMIYLQLHYDLDMQEYRQIYNSTHIKRGKKSKKIHLPTGPNRQNKNSRK